MKLNKILTAMLFLATLVGCGGVGTSSQPNSQSNSNEVGSSINSQGSTTEFSSATSEVNKVENKVKIKSIDVVDEEQKIKNARRMSSGNESSEETSNDIITSSEEIVSSSSENSETSSEETPSIDDINMNKNWVLIYKSQTDITFTVTLDDPRHLGIDALIITCDDPESQIKVGDTYKPIQMEADGTRMVDWGDDPYEQTYHIRTTSPDAVNSFKVLDVRITNHEKFQSEETDNRDLGNNELKIYKMDDDAIELNILTISLDYVKFNFDIKEDYKDIITNICVEGLNMNNGYYIVEEETEVIWRYDFYVECIQKSITRYNTQKLAPFLIDFNEYDIGYLQDGNARNSIQYNANSYIDGVRVENSYYLGFWVGMYEHQYKYVKVTYKGVEAEVNGTLNCIIPNADFRLDPYKDNYDPYPEDLGEKMKDFIVTIGETNYKFKIETIKKEVSPGEYKNVYMISGLEEIVEE